MRITVLTVPDCPNAPVVRQRITAALAGRTATVEVIEVREEAEAALWGMTGSPTVLLDGVDPFTHAGATPSVSCRLYRDAGGTTDGAPGTDELRRALTAAGLPDPGDDDRCDVDVLDPIGRGGRGRHAPAERGLRAVHQAVLRHFAAHGTPPQSSVLEPVAAAAGRTAEDVLAELAREDFLTLDEAGQVRAAYPFSAVPTPHRVSIAGGTQVWSMCAIDALGIPAMLATDAVITSADPVTGQPVTVTSTDGATVWDPADAVVFVGRRCCTGPAAAVCCDVLNFFTGARSARQWADTHPDIVGDVVAQDRALALGVGIFGALLEDDTSESEISPPRRG